MSEQIERTPLGRMAAGVKRRRALTEVKQRYAPAALEAGAPAAAGADAGVTRRVSFGAGGGDEGAAVDLEVRLRRAEAERAELQAALQQMREETSLRERRHEDEQELGAAQLRRECAKIADAEERARLAEAGRVEAQREARNNLRLLEESRETLAEEQRRSIGELARLKAEAAEAEGRAEVAEARSREDAFEGERRLLASESSLEESRRRAAALEADLERSELRLREMTGLCDELRAGGGAGAPGDKENAGASALAAAAEEAAAMRAEVAEARRLRDRLGSQAKLEEQLLDARARADRYERLAGDNEELRGRCEQLEGALARWSAAFAGVRGVEGGDRIREPEELALRLRELQAGAQRAIVREGELEARAAGRAAESGALERRCAQAEAGAAEARAAEAAAAAALRRCERKAGLLLKERDGLQAIIKSYEEETVNLSEGGGAPAPVVTAQLQEAEAALAEAKAQLRAAEEDLEREASAAKSARSELAAERDARGKAAADADGLRRELEISQREVESLARRVGRGEFDPAKTKVLHLVHNPEAEAHRTEAQRELEVLRAENGELRSQLRGRPAPPEGEGEAPTPGAGGEAAVSSAVASAEITVLRRRVADLEKRETRFKTVFKEQISAFREACYFLFGYRIDMAMEKQQTHFVIRSIFSTDGDEDIRFRFTAGEGVEMLPLERPSSKELELNIKTFVHQFKCVPAFTANLTIEMFNKTTVS